MTIKYGTLVKNFKAAAADVRRGITKELGGFIAPREVEFIAFNAQGRVGEPTYGRLGELTGAVVEREVRDLLEQYPVATGVSVEIGYDAYESFGQYIQTAKGSANYDYEPRVEHYSVDIARSEV